MTLKKLCAFLVLLCVTANPVTIKANGPTGWWSTIVYNIQKLKNISWTTPTLTQAAVVATVSAATLCSIAYGITRYCRATHPQNPPAEPQPEHAGSAQVEQSQPPATTQPAANPTTQEQAAHVEQPSGPQDQDLEPRPLAAAAAPIDQLPLVPYFDDSQHHVVEPIALQKENGDRVTVQQLVVLDQHEQDGTGREIGGGHNSCGYHAGPKNIPAIIGLIRGLEPREQFERLLRSSEATRELFNHGECRQGYLRHIIIFRRIKAALTQYYLPKIQIISPEAADAMRSLYQEMIHKFLDNTIAEVLQTGCEQNINFETLVQGLAQISIPIPQELLSTLNISQEEFQNSLYVEAIIKEHICIPHPFTVSLRDSEAAVNAYNEAQRAGDLDPNGELLNEEEIATLLQFQRMSTSTPIAQTLRPQDIATTVIESPDIFRITDSITTLQQHIAGSTLPEQRIHAFVLGNTAQQSASSGHWITMILECAHNQRRYTIANSAHNNISMFSGPAHALIRYLEGDVLALQIKPSEALRQQLTSELHESLARCSQQKDVQSKEMLQHRLTRFQELVAAPDYSSFGGQEAFESSAQRALIA